MKKILFVILVLRAFISSAQDSPVIDHINRIADMERKAHEALSQQLSAVTDNYDLKYHRFVWQVDPAVHYIQGSVTSYFVPVTAGFSEIDFDLSVVMTVDSVTYHNSSLVFAQAVGDLLQITLPSVIPQGTLDSVNVYYHGAPTTSGFGSFVTDTTNYGTPVMWTLSEPFGAKDWWPCKQTLNDKIDSIDVIVTTPQAYRVGSNGLLIEEIQSGSNKIYHWQSHYPIAAYLVAIGVTDYYVYRHFLPLNATDTLEILNYVYPQDTAIAMLQTPDILNIISLYDSLTITYPFYKEKYGHLEFGWGGGQEHQTMSFVVYFAHDLLAHECAHQWFGDRITCGSWEDIWLNEGFATYMEALTEEYLYPVNWYNWKKNVITYVTNLPNGSVLCNDTTNYGRIFDGRLSYDKGAYVLHMLRWKLGDAMFFQSLRNYLNDTLLAYNYAKTPDLKRHLENTSGQNLTNFFDQWYYHEGYPTYHVEWYQSGTDVWVKLNQAQSNASVAFFEMPVPVQFFHGGGQDTTLVFNHTFSGQTFMTPLPFTIDSVHFDDDLWILSRGNTVVNNPTLAVTSFNQENSFIHLYPNPVTNEMIIETDVSLTEVEIVDVLGKTVRSEFPDDLLRKLKINVGGMPDGIYFVRAKTGSGSCVKRFVKM